MSTELRDSSRALGIVTVLGYSIVPLLGVLALGWDWRQVLIFYWLGNISVGLSTIIDILRMPTTIRDLIPQERLKEFDTQQLAKLPLTNAIPPVWVKGLAAGFFMMHYGIFTLGHGIFVFAIVSGNIEGFDAGMQSPEPLAVTGVVLAWLIGAVAQLFVRLRQGPSHESARDSVAAAYKRIVVLHLTIIFGAFLIVLLSLPAIAAVLLIVMNAVSDLAALRKRSVASHVGV